MSLVTNVVRRGGSYYFRVRVPAPLKALVGRSELWKSLRTTHISDARRRAATQAMLTEALWMRLRAVMDMQTATSFVKDWLAADLRAYASLRDELGVALAPTQKTARRPIIKDTAEEAPSQPEIKSSARGSSGLKLSEAGRDFVLEVARSGQVKLKRLQNYETAVAAFASWLGEDRDLAEITSSHAGQFKTALTHYPARGSVNWLLMNGVRPTAQDLSLAQWAQEDDSAAGQIVRRNRLKHSVGNLTLLTQPLNSSASHGSFAEKKAKLQSPKYGSLLVLNREITSHDEWHEDAIETRAAELYALARSTWPIPADITLSSTEA